VPYLLDFRNRLAGIQALPTRPEAVQNRVARVQTYVIIQRFLALCLASISAIGQPPEALQENGWAEVLLLFHQ